MQRQTTHTEDGQCTQISTSQVIALHNAEIEQLAAIVLAQQQCQPIFHSSNSRKRTFHSINSSPQYSAAQNSHNIYSQIQSSQHQCPEITSDVLTHGGSLVQNVSPLHISSPLESPEYLAHRLLVEFGKTRTNYNSLVPRILEIIRMFRDYGPLRCPLPVVSNLDELLNDEALSRIEQRYPNSIEAGFLVLCTERRALRSGGGGKYYFIDTSGRLVGCHKSDLPSYAEKGVLQGPVLLKNLIFVFILRGAFGLDPRCKSSNPQRLLEFYENLSKEGKASDIQSLVRVWSMEIYPEPPYDSGFPHCTLLWVKRMHVSSLISKWRHSQWQTNHFRGHDFYTNSPLTTVLQGSRTLSYSHCSSEHVPQDLVYQFSGVAPEELRAGNLPVDSYTKRRRVTDLPVVDPKNESIYDCWESRIRFPSNESSSIYSSSSKMKESADSSVFPQESSNYDINGPSNDAHSTMITSDINLWEVTTIQKLYGSFSNFASRLQKGDMMDWSVHVIDRLSSPVLEAAMYLISSTLRSETSVGELTDCASGSSVKSLRYDILRILWNEKERHRMAEGLRILLACLVQQQRLEELLSTNTGKENSDSSNLCDTAQNSTGKIELDIPDDSCNLFNGAALQAGCFDLTRRSFTTETTTASAGTENDTNATDIFEGNFQGTSELSSPFCCNSLNDTKNLIHNFGNSAKEMGPNDFFSLGSTLTSNNELSTNPALSSSESLVSIQDLGKQELSEPQVSVDVYGNKDLQNINHYETHSQFVKYLTSRSVQNDTDLSNNDLEDASVESFFYEATGLNFTQSNSKPTRQMQAFDSNEERNDSRVHSIYTNDVSEENNTVAQSPSDKKSLTPFSCKKRVWENPLAQSVVADIPKAQQDDISATTDMTTKGTESNDLILNFHEPLRNECLSLSPKKSESEEWVGVEHWTEGERLVQENDMLSPSVIPIFAKEYYAHENQVSMYSCAKTEMLLSVLCAPSSR